MGYVARPHARRLARAATGDVDAFKTIVERYQGMVYSVAYNVLGNHTDAEDAAQEAFLRCYRKLPQYRGEATFSTWLFRLALTASVDYQRRERRRPEPVEVPDVAGDGQAELGDGITAATLTSALHDLPRGLPRARPCCATSTACRTRRSPTSRARPLGTVKVMVHRGRASLRLRLRAEREA